MRSVTAGESSGCLADLDDEGRWSRDALNLSHPVTLRSFKAEAVLPTAPEVSEVQSDNLPPWLTVTSLLAFDGKVS